MEPGWRNPTGIIMLPKVIYRFVERLNERKIESGNGDQYIFTSKTKPDRQIVIEYFEDDGWNMAVDSVEEDGSVEDHGLGYWLSCEADIDDDIYNIADWGVSQDEANELIHLLELSNHEKYTEWTRVIFHQMFTGP